MTIPPVRTPESLATRQISQGTQHRHMLRDAVKRLTDWVWDSRSYRTTGHPEPPRQDCSLGSRLRSAVCTSATRGSAHGCVSHAPPDPSLSRDCTAVHTSRMAHERHNVEACAAWPPCVSTPTPRCVPRCHTACDVSQSSPQAWHASPQQPQPQWRKSALLQRRSLPAGIMPSTAV